MIVTQQQAKVWEFFVYFVFDLVRGSNFRSKRDNRGGHSCGWDGALGGNPSFEVLKCGDLHPVTTEVVPVGGGTDQKSSCAVCYLGEGLRRVWSLAPLVCLFCGCYFCYFVYAAACWVACIFFFPWHRVCCAQVLNPVLVTPGYHHFPPCAEQWNEIT